MTTENHQKQQPVYLRRSQAVELTGLSESHYKKLAWEGKGPPMVKVGRVCLYDREQLLAWIASHKKGE